MIMNTTAPSDSYVPYLRRRNTPAQLDALIQLFEATPHPTRARRQSLANEIGMELKSVTNWFQNRRQTSRRKSLSSENVHPKTHLSRSPVRHQQIPSKTPLNRSRISLDRIAALSERPSLTLQLDSARLPLTPRKNNVRQRPPSSPTELWTYMLSSPAVPPPDPDPEEARLVALSSQARILYPLEWACLKARQKRRTDEDAGGFTHPVVRHQADERKGGRGPLDPCKRNVSFPCSNVTPQFEDVEAAITLLGFKTRS